MRAWHAGIDTEEWPDARSHEKDIDFLIYDKIRWDHDKLTRELLDPVRTAIERKRLPDGDGPLQIP